MFETRKALPRKMIGKYVQNYALAIFVFIGCLVTYMQLRNDISKLKAEVTENAVPKVQRIKESEIKFARRSEEVQYGVHSDPEDDLVMIYNRVPKTGSTSFMNVAYKLCKRNHFHVLHLNVTKNSHVLTIADQRKFAKNVTTWYEKKPALYHGHSAFLDFSRFGMKKPLYINVLRDPLDRLISYYYFMRYGDDFRPKLKRGRAHDKKTFDECVAEKGRDCDPDVLLWMQVPFFCGHSASCWEAGNRWALEQAKHNLIHSYLLIGVTEHLQDFVAALEVAAPRFFRGALQVFRGDRSHLRKTFNKQAPSEETIKIIRESESWKLENEFYQFARQQFLVTKKRLFGDGDGEEYRAKTQQFRYEKIRPR